MALLAPQDLRLLDMIHFQPDGQLDDQAAAGTITAAGATSTKVGLDDLAGHDVVIVTRVIAGFRAGRPI